MQARYFFVGLAVPPGVVGAVPHAAAHIVRPPAVTAATILIPRARRKTFSFPFTPQPVYGVATSGAYARRYPAVGSARRLCLGVIRP